MKKINVLFEECKQGNKEAIVRICERYAPKIEEIARDYCNLGISSEVVYAYAYKGFLTYLEKCVSNNWSIRSFYIDFRRSLNKYLTIKVLENEGEVVLLFNEYKNGDLTARDKIFEMYKSKAEKIAKEYCDLGLENEEIFEYSYEILLELIYEYKDKDNILSFVRKWERLFESKLIICILREIDSSYLYMKNDIIDFLKNKISLLNLPINQALLRKSGLGLEKTETIGIQHVSMPDLTSSCIYKCLQEDLVNIVSRAHLTEKEMKMFQLMYIEGKSASEIKDIFGVSKQAIFTMKNTVIRKISERCLNNLREFANAKDSVDLYITYESSEFIEDESVLKLESN